MRSLALAVLFAYAQLVAHAAGHAGLDPAIPHVQGDPASPPCCAEEAAAVDCGSGAWAMHEHGAGCLDHGQPHHHGPHFHPAMVTLAPATKGANKVSTFSVVAAPCFDAALFSALIAQTAFAFSRAPNLPPIYLQNLSLRI